MEGGECCYWSDFEILPEFSQPAETLPGIESCSAKWLNY
jgi:hypothetical protein